MDDLIGHSIAYRVAMGARAGQKAFTPQTVPTPLGEQEGEGVARAAGFSPHADIDIEAQARGRARATAACSRSCATATRYCRRHAPGGCPAR
jgi:hypothetical protein